MRSASSFNRHSLLEEDPVTNFVVLPNLQEDVGMLRENLEKLCYYPLTEICMRISEHSTQSRAPRDGDWPPLRGDGSHLSSTWCCWRVAGKIIQRPVGLTTALDEKWCGIRPQQCDHGRRGANTPWCSDTSYFFLVEMFVFRVALLDLCTVVRVTRLASSANCP